MPLIRSFARCDYENELEERERKLAPASDDWRKPEMVAVVTAERAARAELARLAPATLPGMIAYLDYVLSKKRQN
jgi:hypothetical protein